MNPCVLASASSKELREEGRFSLPIILVSMNEWRIIEDSSAVTVARFM